MIGICDDQAAELIRIPKGCEWTVNQTNDLAEFDLRWCSPQPVAALRTGSIHDSGCAVRAASRESFPIVVRPAIRSTASEIPASAGTESNAAADPQPPS